MKKYDKVIANRTARGTHKRVIRLVTFFLCLALTPFSMSEESKSSTNSKLWSGTWQADGTIFTIGVSVSGDEFKIEPIEALGFEWQTNSGVIEQNMGSIVVEFQGATATLGIEILNADTAMVKLVTCLPEYQVTCLLAKGREARFVKVL